MSAFVLYTLNIAAVVLVVLVLCILCVGFLVADDFDQEGY